MNRRPPRSPAYAGPLVLIATSILSASIFGVFASACAEDVPSSAGGPDEPTFDGGADRRSVDSGTDRPDGPALSTCELTRAYQTECNKQRPDGGEELTCGDAKFDTWCEANDKAVNSDSYRRAEARCLTTQNCDGLDRRDCEYRGYADETPTTAQAAVVAAYCQTCEPADIAGCVKRKTTYDPSLGPKSTDDVFVAAWELSDSLCDEIRTKCTGNALDAGSSITVACLKQFGNCAGGIYVDRLPNCP